MQDVEINQPKPFDLDFFLSSSLLAYGLHAIMSLLAQRSLTQVVAANCFELQGQVVVSRLPLERHLASYLKHGGWRPREAKAAIESIFVQARKRSCVCLHWFTGS